ncbi:Cupin domain-containing protein [Murinocardiopsis flavida]|uniref:Cupin domain-containing protein n=1 Tax=Murinocardiopsis flavida TaxID=645275 RepID=A0A2P8DFJ1_9ACTN|nr:cupin domain-containing protein [Murinocardiopsis flavida]PSK95982.1 Cupin domain-containing protein [Murinocardiopsis flavida]
MSPGTEGAPPLPGAIGVSRLRVYDWPGADDSDGFCGGSPHMHLTCTEAYAVIGGRGSVQTLTASGSATTPLREGDLVWFTPGTIHRLVNDGDLRIMVLMQNAGLPEAGDAVFTFPAEVLADPEDYARAAAIAPDAPEASARRRRDLAVSGFTALRERWAKGETEALPDFHQAALALVAPRLADWRERFEHGPVDDVRATARRLEALASGDPSYLSSAGVYRGESAGAWGMCGRLDKYENGTWVATDAESSPEG